MNAKFRNTCYQSIVRPSELSYMIRQSLVPSLAPSLVISRRARRTVIPARVHIERTIIIPGKRLASKVLANRPNILIKDLQRTRKIIHKALQLIRHRLLLRLEEQTGKIVALDQVLETMIRASSERSNINTLVRVHTVRVTA